MRTAAISLCLTGFVIGGCTREIDRSAAASQSGEHVAAPIAAGASRDTREPTPLEAAVARATEREFIIPAGTELPVVLDTTIGSDSSRLEQAVTAHLSRPVLVEGQMVLPEASTIRGVVTEVAAAGKVKGRAHIAVRFNAVTPHGTDDRYQVATAAISRTAPAETKKDALTIAAPAAGGAIIGGIVGGGKGAAIGAAAGGGAGTAVVLTTRGKDVHLPAGSALRVRLTEPLAVKVKA